MLRNNKTLGYRIVKRGHSKMSKIPAILVRFAKPFKVSKSYLKTTVYLNGLRVMILVLVLLKMKKVESAINNVMCFSYF